MSKELLIVIPAYNEAGSIVRVVERLQAVCPQFDYVVVNDGSADDTAALCRAHGFRLLDQPVNLGLAGTFQTGVKYALREGYRAVVQIDGDGQHRMEYIAPMYEKLGEGYDIVIGSRFVTQKKPYTARMIGSRLIALLIRITTGRLLTDPTSGMRMFGPRLLRTLAQEVNYGPEPDTIAHLLRSGAKAAEVQVEMDERTAGVSYLNWVRSIQYMATMCVSIALLQFFRRPAQLRDEPGEGAAV